MMDGQVGKEGRKQIEKCETMRGAQTDTESQQMTRQTHMGTDGKLKRQTYRPGQAWTCASQIKAHGLEVKGCRLYR